MRENRKSGSVRGEVRKDPPLLDTTIEREQREELAAQKAASNGKPVDLPVKRGPGRPKGSKNKKTLEREARIAAAKARVEKRRRRKEASLISDPKPPEGTSTPTTG